MRSFRPSQATSRVVLAWLFLVVAFACGRPIELVDEGVVTVEGELPFSLDALPAEAREALRVGAELVGHGAEVTLRITDEGRLVGEVTYHVETEADVSLVVRVSGARNLAEEPVLLAEHRRTLSLVPRGEEAVTLAKGDFTTKGSAGTDAIRFDKNRNGRANLEDLLAGCAPGVPAPALAVSATDMQFSSAVVPGDYQRQVLVLDNVGDEEVSYWLRVVGAPGVFVSPLLSETLVAPVPGLALGAEGEPLTLAPGEEALVAVTFTPADSRLTTGFLVVESSDPCEVRQASSVRLIGNPDGQYAPPPSFDPGALPEPSELGIDESLPVSTAVNQHIFDGRPTTLPALPAELPAVEIQGAYARAAALLSLPSSTRLGIGLVDLATDADLYVFPVEGTTLGEPFTSIHPGTDPETLVLEPVPEARILLVVVSDAAAEAGARRVEGYTLFFRASSVPTFVPPGLSPRQGSVAGGTSVTLHGAGFRPGAQVYFAGVPASAVVVDPSGNTLTALTPPGLLLRETNPATVSVKNPAEGGAESQYATLPGGFLYLPSAPLVLALDPASGVVDEEHLVHIRGEGFTDFFGPPDVRFGGIPARSVTFVSSTELQVRAPASSTPGSVDVTVSLRGPEPDERIETTAPAAFTWVEPLPVPPTVSSISPTGGPAGRPVVIAVLGEDFAAGARVRFEPVSGGVAVSASSVTFVDENQLGAVVPGLPAGDWAVVVENPDGQRASERPVFQAYTEAGADPFVSALTPDVVHAEVAGDTLSVFGANLASRPLVGVGIEGNGQKLLRFARVHRRQHRQRSRRRALACRQRLPDSLRLRGPRGALATVLGRSALSLGYPGHQRTRRRGRGLLAAVHRSAPLPREARGRALRRSRVRDTRARFRDGEQRARRRSFARAGQLRGRSRVRGRLRGYPRARALRRGRLWQWRQGRPRGLRPRGPRRRHLREPRLRRGRAQLQRRLLLQHLALQWLWQRRARGGRGV